MAGGEARSSAVDQRPGCGEPRPAPAVATLSQVSDLGGPVALPMDPGGPYLQPLPRESQIDLLVAPVPKKSVILYGFGHVLNDLCSAAWFTYLLLFLTHIGLSPRYALVASLVQAEALVRSTALPPKNFHFCSETGPPLQNSS
jgi:hypothetical protein